MMPTLPSPPAIGPVREAFVRPFYLRLLGGSFVRSDTGSDDDFVTRLGKAAQTISDDQIRRLLAEREWRGRLAAAWFVGLSKRVGFRQAIGDLLLASELVYAGEGYCLALGLIGDDPCRATLRAYLERYLPLKGRAFDQEWAVGALAHVEGRPPREFLYPHLWVGDNFALDPHRGIQRFAKVVAGLRQYGLV